jgi:uncharacterized protein YbjQ (UPF0145 family)
MANCTRCNKKLHMFDAKQGICPDCRSNQERAARESRERLLNGLSVRPDPMIEERAERARLAAALGAIILTTESATSLPISERLEIVAAECVLGMNIFQDIGSAIRDVVGGRNETYQAKLREARNTVLAELKREAFRLGADAVVAVDLDYSEISGGGKSMLFLVASGTAVRLSKQPAEPTS